MKGTRYEHLIKNSFGGKLTNEIISKDCKHYRFFFLIKKIIIKTHFYFEFIVKERNYSTLFQYLLKIKKTYKMRYRVLFKVNFWKEIMHMPVKNVIKK